MPARMPAATRCRTMLMTATSRSRRFPAASICPSCRPHRATATTRPTTRSTTARKLNLTPQTSMTRKPRRFAGASGMVVIMAVLGLAVLGSAGALGYRAMFGGLMLPSLPPIIKAADGPNKIVPSHADVLAGTSSQADATSKGSAEKLVPHQEQPVDIRTCELRPACRFDHSGAPASPNSAWPGAQPPAAPGAVASPPGLPEAAAAAAPSASSAAPGPRHAAGPAHPAAASAEPKKIHTVTIRPDQLGGASAAAAAPAPPRARRKRVKLRPSRARTGRVRLGLARPLAIVPAQDDAPPAAATSDTHGAGAPVDADDAHAANVRAGCMPRPPRPPTPSALSPGGGYAVQVTSQRSEGRSAGGIPLLCRPNSLGSCEATSRSSAAPISAPRASTTAPLSGRLPPWNRPPDLQQPEGCRRQLHRPEKLAA